MRRSSSDRLTAVPPRQHTFRAASGVIETIASGRSDPVMMRAMIDDFVKLGRSSIWLIDITEMTSYAPEGIAEASKLFGAEGDHGLRRIITIVRAPLVRMGAQVVAMSLAAAKSNVEVKVVENRVEASKWLVF